MPKLLIEIYGILISIIWKMYSIHGIIMKIKVSTLLNEKDTFITELNETFAFDHVEYSLVLQYWSDKRRRPVNMFCNTKTHNYIEFGETEQKAIIFDYRISEVFENLLAWRCFGIFILN